MSYAPPHEQVGPSIKERIAWGKSLRQQTPRSSHRDWLPAADRPDPIAMIEATSLGRLPDLVPIRHGRMLPSPFTFLRAAAAAMACDLASTPVTGITVQLCGDCHLLNFGIFATPERNLVFDVNDFDETYPGPWEWDVKRLAASFVVAGRSNGLTDRDCLESAREVVRSYREHMREYASMGVLETWYHRLDSNLLVKLASTKKERQQRREETIKARQDTTARVFPRMTEVADGQRRIIDHPPRIFHLTPGDPLEAEMRAALDSYPETLQDDRRFQLSRYKLVDLAMKVVGVGSVGTRCGVFLLMASDRDPLFLQIKEARRSVLEPYVQPFAPLAPGGRAYQNEGHRVVTGQRLLQATSDIFLGWAKASRERERPEKPERPEPTHHYYLRQLRDSKGCIDVDGMAASSLGDYAEACGWALARGHAKSGDAAAISGYLGRGDAFDCAIADFAGAYADQTERDHDAMTEAVRTGRLVAQVEKPA